MYSSPKIIFAKIAKRCEAFLDRDGEYASLNTNCFYEPRPRVGLEYVLAFCNSRLFHFIYGQFFGALRMASGYFQFQAPQLRVIPIRQVSPQRQNLFTRSVQDIIRCGQGVEAGAEETIQGACERIDQMFYSLYELGPREVAEIVDETADELPPPSASGWHATQKCSDNTKGTTRPKFLLRRDGRAVTRPLDFPAKKPKAAPKRPAAGASITDFDRDQLKAVLLEVVGTDWIERDDAIRAAAQSLGFKRTGKRIHKAFASAITGLLRQNLLEHDRNTIRRK